MGVPNSSFYPQFVRLGKKNLIFSEIFPFFREQMYIWGTKLQFLSPSGQKNFIFSEIFPFLANKCTFVVPNSSFYPQFVRSGQKNFIFSEIVPFLGNKCTFGGTKLQFLSQSGQKNFIFSEMFPFLGNKCTFGGTKPVFIPIGSKKLHF